MSKTVKVESVEVARRAQATEECLDYALAGAVAYAGGVLTGFSLRVDNVGFLLTLRALFPAGHRVAHIGGMTITEAFLKAVREANADNLHWKVDIFRS